MTDTHLTILSAVFIILAACFNVATIVMQRRTTRLLKQTHESIRAARSGAYGRADR